MDVSFTERARRCLVRCLVTASVAALAACGSHTPPPPPPPPPPVAEYIPPRPAAPYGASANLVMPPLGPDGLRQSVDRGISPAQALWNLRSAWNVAALECPEPQYSEIQDGYRAFLKSNAKVLKATQRQVDVEFHAKYGPDSVRQRDKYLTEVYNHFALPPTLPYLCSAVAAVERDAAGVPPAGLSDFAQRSLPSIEIVFDEFFRQYDQYRADAAAWDARYGARITDAGAQIGGSSQAGPGGGASPAPSINPSY